MHTTNESVHSSNFSTKRVVYAFSDPPPLGVALTVQFTPHQTAQERKLSREQYAVSDGLVLKTKSGSASNTDLIILTSTCLAPLFSIFDHYPTFLANWATTWFPRTVGSPSWSTLLSIQSVSICLFTDMPSLSNSVVRASTWSHSQYYLLFLILSSEFSVLLSSQLFKASFPQFFLVSLCHVEENLGTSTFYENMISNFYRCQVILACCGRPHLWQMASTYNLQTSKNGGRLTRYHRALIL